MSESRMEPVLVTDLAGTFLRSAATAVHDLARLLERIELHSQNLDTLDKKLDETNELLRNLIKVLDSAR